MANPVPIRPARKRAAFSTSPLVAPESPIYAFASRFQDFYHFPDPRSLYTVIGSIVANMFRGHDPVWLMLVGPSASGKTTLLESMKNIEGTMVEASIKGESSLLSGVKKKDHAPGAKGGLLKELPHNKLGEHYGAIAFMDLSGLITKSKESADVLDAMRDIYDGNWTRRVGTEGGHRITWKGKIGLYAGVTGAIDRAQAVIGELGDRFIYYRMPDSDGWQESLKALENRNEGERERKEELKELMASWFEGQGFRYSEPIEAPDLSDAERNRIIAIGQIAAKGKSSVVRDAYTREVVDVPQASEERPTRLNKQFGTLYRAFKLIELRPQDRWDILQKLMFDAMPLTRRMAFEQVIAGVKHAPEIAERIGVSGNAAKRAVEELKLHGLVSKDPEAGKEGGWVLSEFAEHTLQKAKGER